MQYTDNANASLGALGGGGGGPQGPPPHPWAGAELVGGAPPEGLSLKAPL